MAKIVIALGGNALGKNAQEQREIVKVTAKSIVDLYEQGNKVVIAHGNGPQVGMINSAFGDAKVDMPFPECGAMSQGYIGYHIQSAIRNEAKKRNIDVTAVSLVTQTEVIKDDPAFKNPTKPIGAFFSKEEAKELSKEKGWDVKEDAGRGWRRVVPSPMPLKIVEKRAIELLIKDDKTIVIAGGGGGIPVIEEDGVLKGVAAVIDKDTTASKIASSINADLFIILTAVDKIFINYGKSNEKALENISLPGLKKFYDDGIFAEGSMKPKVKAVMDFVEETGNPGYIADLKRVGLVLSGQAGTKVTK